MFIPDAEETPIVHYRFNDMLLGGVALEKFYQIKETPAGYWLVSEEFCFGGINIKRIKPSYKEIGVVWVSKYSGKRRAHPTMEEAYESYMYRKRYQVRVLTTRLANAQANMKAAEEFKDTLFAEGYVNVQEQGIFGGKRLTVKVETPYD